MVSCAKLALDDCSGSDTFLVELLEINSKLEEEMGKLYYEVSANVEEGASENLMARLQGLETVRGAVKLLVTELLQLDKSLDKKMVDDLVWTTLRLVAELLEQQLAHCRLLSCPDLPPCSHCAAAVLHSAVKRLDKFQLILDGGGETEDHKAAVRAGVVRLISDHSDKSRIIRQREATLADGASLLSCAAQQQEVYARLQ